MTTGQMDWNIRARSSACEVCHRPFEDQEALFSRLEFGEEGYVRRDYCKVCWSDALRQGAVSVWKSVFQAPPPPPPEPIKKETAESLLRKLMETDDPANWNVIFILAVMLERKRILVERDIQTREDGVRVRVYEHRKTGESFLIADPKLRLADLERIQAEVLERLGGTPHSEPAGSSMAEQSGALTRASESGA